MRKARFAVIVLTGALLSGAALAQGRAAPGPGPGFGYGDCPGFGYGMGGGPGMMGPGMMGGGMMGPGMMGGGMMGRGMGYYGYGMLGALDLTEQQRKDVGKVIDTQQKRHYELMGKRMEIHSRLRDLYGQEKWDATAISKAYEDLASVQRDMVRASVEARNRIHELLTPEQRKQFRQWGDPIP